MTSIYFHDYFLLEILLVSPFIQKNLNYLHPRMFSAKFELALWFWRKRFLNVVNIFFQWSCISHDLSFEQTWIPFTQECILLSLFLSGYREDFKFWQCFFSIISLGKGHAPSFEQNIQSLVEIDPVVLKKINTFTDRWANNIQHAIREAQVLGVSLKECEKHRKWPGCSFLNSKWSNTLFRALSIVALYCHQSEFLFCHFASGLPPPIAQL